MVKNRLKSKLEDDDDDDYKNFYMTNLKEKNIAMYFSGRIFSDDFEDFKKKIQFLPFFDKIIFFVSLNQSKEITLKDTFFNNFCKDLKILLPSQVNIETTPLHNFSDVLNKANKQKGCKVNNVVSMFYHNKQCFNLIENFCKIYNHKFDIVIRFRADIDIKSTLDISRYIIEEKNTIYISSFRWPTTNEECDDCVAFGNFESMKKYSDLISNIRRYCLNEKSSIHPETLLKYHLDSSSLIIKAIPFEYTLYSSRHKYDLYKDQQLIQRKHPKKLSLRIGNPSLVFGIIFLMFLLKNK